MSVQNLQITNWATQEGGIYYPPPAVWPVTNREYLWPIMLKASAWCMRRFVQTLFDLRRKDFYVLLLKVN